MTGVWVTSSRLPILAERRNSPTWQESWLDLEQNIDINHDHNFLLIFIDKLKLTGRIFHPIIKSEFAITQMNNGNELSSGIAYKYKNGN